MSSMLGIPNKCILSVPFESLWAGRSGNWNPVSVVSYASDSCKILIFHVVSPHHKQFVFFLVLFAPFRDT